MCLLLSTHALNETNKMVQLLMEYFIVFENFQVLSKQQELNKLTYM